MLRFNWNSESLTETCLIELQITSNCNLFTLQTDKGRRLKDDIVDRVSTFNMPPVVALVKVRYVEGDIIE